MSSLSLYHYSLQTLTNSIKRSNLPGSVRAKLWTVQISDFCNLTAYNYKGNIVSSPPVSFSLFSLSSSRRFTRLLGFSARRWRQLISRRTSGVASSYLDGLAGTEAVGDADADHACGVCYCSFCHRLCAWIFPDNASSLCRWHLPHYIGNRPKLAILQRPSSQMA